MRAEFHPAARDELNEAARRYESQVTGLGSRFLAIIDVAASFVGRNSKAGKPIEYGLRRWGVGDFPY